jgi:hypothetical protein
MIRGRSRALLDLLDINTYFIHADTIFDNQLGDKYQPSCGKIVLNGNG